MSWIFEKTGKVPPIKNPILIEGLPGIGNVGKIAVDFLIEELGAKRIYSLFSHSLPHSVFVNEKNLIELPVIELYHAKIKKQDFLFLSGDVQPVEEVSSYAFCDAVLDFLLPLKPELIITTGGIGLQQVPEKPAVYISGNNKKVISSVVKKTKVNPKLYGVVGPIIGVSGLLLGLAQKRKLPAICLLAETFGHPMYVGMVGAREIVSSINKYFSLKIDMRSLDKEVHNLQRDIKKAEELGKITKQAAIQTLSNRKEMNYIG